MVHRFAIPVQLVLKDVDFLLIELLSILVGLCDLANDDLLKILKSINFTEQHLRFALIVEQPLNFGFVELGWLFFEVVKVPENVLKLRSLITV